MSDIITLHVHRVLDYGIALKERLERGERPDLPREQAELKNLLMGDADLRALPDYAGEGRFDSIMGNAMPAGPKPFRGVRYALTCWLDEIFIDGPPEWSNAWAEQKLESSQYGSNDRAWRFWEEAKLAEQRGAVVLEAFYWCVMLGFRGELRAEPQKLDAWVRAVRARLVSAQPQDWPLPPEREVPVNVPPRGFREAFQNMMYAWSAALLIAVPVLAFILVQLWGSR
ncbi:MAG: DotU family type IV/VI secretion system protein [Gemmataceae bacterium]